MTFGGKLRLGLNECARWSDEMNRAFSAIDDFGPEPRPLAWAGMNDAFSAREAPSPFSWKNSVARPKSNPWNRLARPRLVAIMRTVTSHKAGSAP